MNIPQITPELKSAVETYFLAKAYEETIRPIVEGYRTQILLENNFEYRDDLFESERRKPDSKFVKDEKDTYLMKDEQFTVYLGLVHEQHLSHGFDVKEFGYCPLLIAEDNTRKAKRLVLESAEYIWSEHIEKLPYKMDHYNKLFDMIVGLVVKLADIDSQKIMASVTR